MKDSERDDKKGKVKKFAYARNEPFILEMAPGRYAWCSCGNSKKQPF